MSSRGQKKQPPPDKKKSSSKKKNAKAKSNAAFAPPAEGKRPSPVPNPPTALVRLIEKDKKVHEYFTSLNANLLADVQKYRKRSEHYLKLCKELQEEVDNIKNASEELRPPAPKRQRIESEKADNKESSKPAAQENLSRVVPPVATNAKTKDGPPETIHINAEQPEAAAAAAETVDDSMFEFQSSDDDEDDDDEEKGNENNQRNGNGKEGDDGNKNNNNSNEASNHTIEKAPVVSKLEGQVVDDSLFAFQSSDDDDSDEASVSFLEKTNGKTAKNIYAATPKKAVIGKQSRVAETPIDDSAIRMKLPSYDDDSEDEGGTETAVGTQTAVSEHQRFIASELLDAYRCLQHLGVELVEKTTIRAKKKVDISQGPIEGSDNDLAMTGDTSVPIENTNQNSIDQEDEEEGFSFLPDRSDTQALRNELLTEQPTTTVVMKRRPDEDVVADLLDAIRSLTRINVSTYGGLPSEYHAFRMAPHWIPCGDVLPEKYHDGNDAIVDHPARVGKICMFRALSVMDCYAMSAEFLDPASHFGPKDPWEEICQCLEADSSTGDDLDLQEIILIGMADRKAMVNDLMESLSGEMAGVWAIMDRSSRIQTDALFFDEADASKGEASDIDDNLVLEKSSKANGGSIRPKLFLAAGTKSLIRLASLAERRIFAQIMTNLYLARNDPRSAFQSICDYILSAAPSLHVEDYPKMQPVLSMVILEGMMVDDNDFTGMLNNDEDELDVGYKTDDNGVAGNSIFCWFGHVLRHNCHQATLPNSQLELKNLPRKMLALSIHIAGYIWGQRLESDDQRITDMARCEWASYLRLLESQALWLLADSGPVVASTSDKGKSIQSSNCLESYQSCLNKIIDDFQLDPLSSTKDVDERQRSAVLKTRNAPASPQALSLALVLLGDTEKAVSLFGRAVDALMDRPDVSDTKVEVVHASCIACLSAFRQLKIRQVDALQQQRNSYLLSNAKLDATRDVGEGVGPDCLTALYQYLKRQVECNEDETAVVLQPSLVWSLFATLLECCSLTSNGELAVQAVEVLLAFDQSLSERNGSREGESSLCVPKALVESIEQVAEIPFLRVVNLERRKDRWISFMAQSMESSVLISRGVALLEGNDGDKATSLDMKLQASSSDLFLFGDFAFDGKLGLTEVMSQVFKGAGDKEQQQLSLETYVEPKWRPHDLKAFDNKASNDEKILVRVSDTERACALSHIGTWKGVLRSLRGESLPQSVQLPPSNSFLRHTGSLRSLFLSSGFARGPPLDSKSLGMQARAVCVVLEDDAILCDRFAERLDSLLEELPRDFHFCSLGYGRPSTAPLVKFSPQLCIPTCIWYLTGYIVSLEGAEHLLSSLPVRGPVDSWVGLKMCANWENSFGETVGVGVQSKPRVDAPPRADLAKIMQFRAFAALDPLCTQKVLAIGSSAPSGVAGRNWRQRDTDITYSGSDNYSG